MVATISGVVNSPLVNVDVANFTSSVAGATAASFAATITWGDGTASAGTIVPDASTPPTFHVEGSHTYTSPRRGPLIAATVSQVATTTIFVGGVAIPTVSNASAGTTTSVRISENATIASSTPDFDGDGAADLAVYGKDPATGRYRFRILMSSAGFAPSKAVVFDNQGLGFGNPSSIPVVADYFGDGKFAYAIWSPDGHGFMILQAISSANFTKALSIDFGLTTDVPVVADVDGDGKADFGVFGLDPNLGYRYDFLLSSRNFDVKQPLIFNNYGFGYGAPGATPVVADLDGSGHAGFGVYIPSGTGGTFTYTNVAIPKGTTGPIVNPIASAYFARSYGFAADIPMAVDYDGDGRADLAFYGLDPRTGRYRYDILTSSTNFNTNNHVYFDNAGLGYGYSASIPVMADYEGNGHADFAVFQPDGIGGAAFVFQDVGVGHGVVYTFASPTDLPVDAPAFILARKVRGH
jgi:hypothetical protein